MENRILENHFETVYKEYKEYDSYIESTREEVEKRRKDFKDRVLESKESDDILSSELFELSLRPIQSHEDLRILRDRLISVYDAYKIVIDFPSEVSEEIKALKRPIQTYRVANGKQEVIDKARQERQKEDIKNTHLEIISALKTV
jgi:hypothetical protein